jgi:ribosomal protein S18 acetylase RimI-like enzyme
VAPADDILFQPATAGDIPVIRDLASRIWREHYPGIITREQIDYMLERMYAADVIRDEMANKGHRYVLARRSGEPVGFVAFVQEPAEHAVKIGKLYLLPSLHGKGIGRRMLQLVKDEALRSGARTITLFVNKKNTRAIRAYERFGFGKAGGVVTDIGGGFVMDDYLMVLHW